MNMCSTVRFVIEPMTDVLSTQVRMTFGKKMRDYDHWSYTSDLHYMRNASAARPLVKPALQLV